MNEPRPRITSARPFEAALSVEKRWNTRIGSSEESTVTAEPRWMRCVRPAIAASTISGADTAKSAPVVLADAEGVDAERVGEDALLDHVADDLRLRQQAAVRPEGDVAECIEAELKFLRHLMWDRPRRIRSLWQPIYCHSLRNPAVVPCCRAGSGDLEWTPRPLDVDLRLD